ncbi:MAG: Cof-type HAD-IIB family hydrolase [Collinsella sp.]|nr:Cof-type HAD-IIB family hydrolase [Collinsella sp.]
MIKAAFFDIDGTLLSFKTHLMPESTKRALAALRERGVLTIVSSGRPTYQLPPCIATGFDAYVTLNGQLCLDREGVFRSVPIAPASVRMIVDQVRDGAYDVLVLQEKRSFCNARSERVLAAGTNAGLDYEQDDISCALTAPVYQFCAFIDPADEHVLTDRVPGISTTRWTDIFCDVVPDQGGKSFGVRAALERYGISPEEAVAFGDGENDLSMFDAVGTSVAMGNSWDIVKDHADLVTSSVDEDGILRACERLGLI